MINDRDYCEELLDAFEAASHEDIVNRAAPRAARLVGAYQRLCADRDAWKERAERARAELIVLRAGDAGERNAEFIDAALSDDPPSGIPWPTWLPPTLRAELVDYEQMAMGASECGGEIATRARLLAHDLRELCDWLDATKSAADGLKDAMRRRP